MFAERDENAERKDFTPTEAVAIGRLIEEQHKQTVDASKHERAVRAGQASWSKRSDEPNTSPKRNPVGDTVSTAAAAVGMGYEKYTRAKAVVVAAETDPETFGDLPERMDETGNVTGTHREQLRPAC